MNPEEKVSPCVKRWLENFSQFNMKLVHMPCKLIPADPLSRLSNLPSAVGSELNSSVDSEPRYPLTHPLDKIDKIEMVDKERLVEYAELVRICPKQPPLQDNNKFHSLGGHSIIQPSRPTIYLLPRYKGKVYLR